MKINFVQLTQQLKQSLAPVYLIAGDEPVLIQQTKQIIRERSIAAGFNEAIKFTVDSSFETNNLHLSLQSFSLFSAKQYIEIRLQNLKLQEPLKELLIAYLQQPSTDKIIVITCPKLDGPTQNSHWIKTIDKAGVLITLWPLQNNELYTWILQRGKQHGITISADAAKLLMERTEGNLLATQQEIDKLALLYPDSQISLEQVASNSIDNSRYSIFDFVDTILKGEYKNLLRTLYILQAEGTETTIILWALIRETRQLFELKQELESGKSLSQVLAKPYIWEKRKPLFSRTLNCHSLDSLKHCLQHAHLIDRIIKGMAQGDVWQELSALALDISGKSLFKQSIYQQSYYQHV